MSTITRWRWWGVGGSVGGEFQGVSGGALAGQWHSHSVGADTTATIADATALALATATAVATAAATATTNATATPTKLATSTATDFAAALSPPPTLHPPQERWLTSVSAISLSAPSQGYSTLEEEEACRL
jgi:hypothetical protein